MQKKCSVVFEFNGIAICLLAPNILYINWCMEYFGNYISVVNKDIFDIKIEMTFDSEYFKINRYSSIKSNAYFDLSCDSSQKNFIVYCYSDISIACNFMRLVRNIMLKELEKRNFIFLHAACVSTNGKGVGITGPKFSGKTTTCFSMMSSGLNFTTNDKLALKINCDDIDACGIPVSIGVRKETLKLFSNINFHGENGVESDKLYYTPKKLCEVFHTHIQPISKLKLFIVPIYDSTKDTLEVIELNDNEKKSIIDSEIISSIYEDYSMSDYCSSNEKEKIDLMKFHLQKIKFYQVKQNALSLKHISEKVISLLNY